MDVSNLMDYISKPFLEAWDTATDAYDVLAGEKTYQKPEWTGKNAKDLDTIDLKDKNNKPRPKKEIEEQRKMMGLREAQGEYEASQATPIMDFLTNNLNDLGEGLSSGMEDIGEGVGQAYDKMKGFVEENPNFLIGMTPTLLGALSGELGLGAARGAEGINKNLEYQRKTAAAEAKRRSDKPLTKANITPILDDQGNQRYARIEDAVGQEVPEKDGFNLEAKMKLARFKDRLKNKSGADFNTEQKFRKEYGNDPITKTSKNLAMQFQKIQDLGTAPQTSANDLSMIFAYMKMLDPTSVVREGEQMTARKTGAIPDYLWNEYERLTKGKDALLPKKVRSQFVTEAQRIYQGQMKVQSQVDNTYKSLASQYGMDPSRVMVMPRIEIKDMGGDSGNGFELHEQDGNLFLKLPNGNFEFVRKAK